MDELRISSPRNLVPPQMSLLGASATTSSLPPLRNARIHSPPASPRNNKKFNIDKLKHMNFLRDLGLQKTVFAGEIDTEKTSKMNSGECAVCLATYLKDEELVTLKCMHVFHVSCIEKWLKKEDQCPLCRKAQV